jgi:hypothetical protein
VLLIEPPVELVLGVVGDVHLRGVVPWLTRSFRRIADRQQSGQAASTELRLLPHAHIEQ